MKHLYGLITLLTLFTGIVTLTLGALSAARSKEKHLKFFLVILAAFNGKFLVDFLWGYLILNIPDHPTALFGVVLTISCVFDLVYFFFFILLWNSLFALGFKRWMLAAAAVGLTVVFALVLLGGTWDAAGTAYRPGWPACIGNLAAVMAFLWIIFTGVSHYSRKRDVAHRFFLGVTLLCLCAGFLQMAGSLLVRLARFPDLELRAPRPEEIGFPWLSLYFALYMAAIIFFFLKQYLMTAKPAAVGPGAPVVPAAPAALESFGLRYGLSTREREILALVVEGCSNGEIAKRFFITTGTVKTHMHNVFKKTGTGSRPRLLRLFLT